MSIELTPGQIKALEAMAKVFKENKGDMYWKGVFVGNKTDASLHRIHHSAEIPLLRAELISTVPGNSARLIITKAGLRWLEENAGMGGGGEDSGAAVDILEVVVQELASWRRYFADADAAYKHEIEANQRLKTLKEKRDNGKARVAELEQTLRDAAIAQYTAYPEQGKRIHPKVEIKLTTRYEYNHLAADEWSKSEAPLLREINIKKFEDMLKSIQPPAFVTVMKVPKAYIAKDLDND